MAKSNSFVFIALHIVAWLIFVGLSIEAGALIVNFIYSLFKPENVHYLYQKLDLSQMYHLSKLAYFTMYSFILVISILKAYLFYLVIQLVSHLDLSKPFSSFVPHQVTQISYYTLSIELISYLSRQTSNNLEHKGFEVIALNQFWTDSQAFILMAAVIYVLANIFSRGVELQSENDLTV